MNDAWIEFCEKENKNRINELKKRIKELEENTKGKEIKNFKMGEYKITPPTSKDCR